jgi:hypothetical protein
MAISSSQTVFSPWLTPIRLVSTSNIAGTYSNGPNNNGVGATLTIAATSLTIDSVVCEVGDRVLLQTQTNTNEQGIYIVKEIDATVVLERSSDQQSVEQLKEGQYTVTGAGTVNAGSFFTLIEPLPNRIGVDPIYFMATPSSTAGVTFSGGASTANALAVYSNTSGDLKAANAPTNLGQPLTVSGTVSANGVILTKVNGTEVGGNVTANGSAGVITTSSLNTAAGAQYTITWTNSLITPTSVVLVSIMGGTNSIVNIAISAVAGSGVSTIVIANNDPAAALNGTIIIGYQVL